MNTNKSSEQIVREWKVYFEDMIDSYEKELRTCKIDEIGTIVSIINSYNNKVSALRLVLNDIDKEVKL